MALYTGPGSIPDLAQRSRGVAWKVHIARKESGNAFSRAFFCPEALPPQILACCKKNVCYEYIILIIVLFGEDNLLPEYAFFYSVLYTRAPEAVIVAAARSRLH